MTDLRTAAQQALECLKGVARGKYDGNAAEVCAALRAALAQQAEQAEPVAKVELMMTGGNAGLATRIVEIDDHLRERLRPGQLLYTAPPQRKPLTDEEIRDLWSWSMTAEAERTATTQQHAFTRAIERAHGITDPQVADRLARHGIPMPGDPK